MPPEFFDYGSQGEELPPDSSQPQELMRSQIEQLVQAAWEQWKDKGGNIRELDGKAAWKSGFANGLLAMKESEEIRSFVFRKWGNPQPWIDYD
jgi:hypothetical protein